ncbi:MAG: cytochrome c biogenesis protein CcdA [Candidatus Omnitrophica bacterium]|nr:cytochrome c biogenesis protein CcdA [Candidatus Omnitrophota bacterium]
METSSTVSYAIAFISGLLVFMSPCILPLIPTYISYLTGVAFKELTGEITPEIRRRIRLVTVVHSLLFIIGFSVIFVLLGTTVSYAGKMLLHYQVLLKKISAAIIILFGLMITGVFRIAFLEKEHRVEYRKSGVTYLGSFIVGATFAFAWTPCVGLVLGSILAYASSTASVALGVRLLVVFSLGLAIPFFAAALLINSFLLYVKKIRRYIGIINKIGGIILIGFGVLILTGGVR